jgi:PEP-CTERM motif
MKVRCVVLTLAFALSLGLAAQASATPVSWTDWTSTMSTASGVVGSITTGSTTIDVGFTGPYSFAQVSGGTNYWNPSAPYIGAAVDNAPPASDIIALGTGGTATITFSQPVLNPLIALVSWNGNTVEFGVPITILSYGSGYFGNGTPIPNAGGSGFFGNGEVHGVIVLPGTYSSITFTHTFEYWHGFTVGVMGEAPSTVPDPGSSLLLLGIGLVGLRAWKRRQ